MEHIDTYLIMRELQHRLADCLYDPDPSFDHMVSDLLDQSPDNEYAMKKIEREMRILMERYTLLLNERNCDSRKIA